MSELILPGIFAAFCLGLALLYRRDAMSSVNSLGALLTQQKGTEAERVREIVACYQRAADEERQSAIAVKSWCFQAMNQVKEHEARLIATLTAKQPSKAKTPPAPKPEPIVQNGRLTRREPVFAAHDPNAEGG